jgi:superfamily II DNA/RNA helicase
MLRGDAGHRLFRAVPTAAPIALFSAPWPADKLAIAAKVCRSPARVGFSEAEVALPEAVAHYRVSHSREAEVDREEWKLDTLCDIYATLSITQCIVFVDSNEKVDWLVDKLQQSDFTCSAIHSAMEQGERDIVMQEFRSGRLRRGCSVILPNNFRLYQESLLKTKNYSDL